MTLRGASGFFALGAGYAVVVAVSAVHAVPTEFGDTYRYFGSALWDIQNPGVTPVAAYTLLKTPDRVYAMQVSISALAWTVLAGLSWWRMGTSRFRWVVTPAILLLSLTSPVWSWNSLLGSESLALSAGALWLASIIGLTDSTTRPYLRVLAHSLAVIGLLATRPALLPLVLTVEIVICAWALRVIGRTSAAVMVVVALVTSAFAGTRLLLLSSNNVFRFRYAIDNYVDKATSFRIFADRTMPPCRPLVEAVNGPRPWDDVWVLKERLISVCPESYLWLRSGKSSVYSWAVHFPAESLSNAGGALTSVRYENYTPAQTLPGPIDMLLVPFESPWLMSVIALLIGVSIAWAMGLRLRITLAWMCGAALVLGSAVLTIFLIWAADGIELSRHLVPLTTLVPVAGLALPPTMLTRRRGIASGPRSP